MVDLTEDDKNWIKKYIKEVGDVKGFYPKFQYSIFPNGKEEQIVIRCETYEELIQAKRDINPILEKLESKTEAKTTPQSSSVLKTKPCVNCGGIRKLVEGVKNGKRWAGWFCENEVSNCPVEWIPIGKK